MGWHVAETLGGSCRLDTAARESRLLSRFVGPTRSSVSNLTAWTGPSPPVLPPSCFLSRQICLQTRPHLISETARRFGRHLLSMRSGRIRPNPGGPPSKRPRTSKTKAEATRQLPSPKAVFSSSTDNTGSSVALSKQKAVQPFRDRLFFPKKKPLGEDSHSTAEPQKPRPKTSIAPIFAKRVAVAFEGDELEHGPSSSESHRRPLQEPSLETDPEDLIKELKRALDALSHVGISPNFYR